MIRIENKVTGQEGILVGKCTFLIKEFYIVKLSDNKQIRWNMRDCIRSEITT